MAFRFVFFDVAQTLLHKPLLFPTIRATLRDYGYEVAEERLRRNHKLLSEWRVSPDNPTFEFYRSFNADLVISLGVKPEEQLLEAIFTACRGLEWAPCEDAGVVETLPIPVGVISNWDSTLAEKLQRFFNGQRFFRVIGSSSLGWAKPAPEIFEAALAGLDGPRSDALFVGDSFRVDILPAREAGMTAVLIDRDDQYGGYSGPRIRTLHDLDGLIASHA